ncbi:MAG: zinc ribbon domain-containing protein [Eubacteriales bacterium]|nr:zinc ribbon domain-containing protein [Eubacteriales bacterium]
MFTNILLLIGIIVGIGVIGTVAYVSFRVRSFSRKYLGTDDIVEGIKNQQEIYDSTPKDVSSLTRLELPRIERDFPEFNWSQWKQICETRLKQYLEAKSSKNAALLKDAADGLKEQLRNEIESAVNAETEEKYEQVTIHQTEIAKYDKKPGLCRIKVEASVQYFHTLIRKGRTNLDNKIESNIYVLELVYIQDPSLVGNEYATAIGTNCPNCGAPVKILGNKICPYCGTGIEPINIKVWQLHRIEKEKY